jgi:hypothetical protein
MKVSVATRLTRRIARHLFREGDANASLVGLPFSSNAAPYPQKTRRQARFRAWPPGGKMKKRELDPGNGASQAVRHEHWWEAVGKDSRSHQNNNQPE